MHEDLTNGDLIAALRRVAAVWFKDADLMLLEELIKRYQRLWEERAVNQKEPSK